MIANGKQPSWDWTHRKTHRERPRRVEAPAGKTVVAPLIGVSKVDFPSPGADPFIADAAKRTELRERMEKSMKGILKGVKDHVTKQGEKSSLEEFAVVILTRDMNQLVSKKERESKTLGTDRGIGGYWTVKTALTNTFSEGAHAIRSELKK